MVHMNGYTLMQGLVAARSASCGPPPAANATLLLRTLGLLVAPAPEEFHRCLPPRNDALPHRPSCYRPARRSALRVWGEDGPVLGRESEEALGVVVEPPTNL